MFLTDLRKLVCLACPALAIVAFSAGCAAPGPRGEIPFGTWSGRGVFVYEHWKPADKQAEREEPRSIHRTYPTRLNIRPGELNGHEIVELEIHSDRGPLPGMKEKATHLKVALVKAKRVSESVVLYRLVGFLLDPAPDGVLRFDNNAPPFGASCATINGATTLQIDYMDNFADTFRFEGEQVEKTGVYFKKKEGLIHWVEHLTRCK